MSDLTKRCLEIAEDSPTAPTALSNMLELFAAQLYENREFARFFMTELWRDGRAWSAEMREKTKGLVSVIAQQITRGQVEGVIRANIEPEFSAVSLVGMVITDAMYYAGVEGSPLMDKQTFITHARDFARNALMAPIA